MYGASMDLPQTLDNLERLGTCIVSDALESLGLPGGFARLPICQVERPVAGQAVTLQLTHIKESSQTSEVHLGSTAIMQSNENTILVVENGMRSEAACWGGLLTRAAKQAGVRGVLVGGSVRDVDEIEALRMPIMAQGATPKTARGRYTELSTNVQIKMSSVNIDPNDLILIDQNGVSVIPLNSAQAVVASACALAEIENGFARELDEGGNAADVLNHRYETMLKAST